MTTHTMWTKIYTTTNMIEAEIVSTMLNDNGITAVEMNKQDSSYLSFGTIDLYCPANQAIQALHLIRSNTSTEI
jgi:Zn-dependent membrane protease YugP